MKGGGYDGSTKENGLLQKEANSTALSWLCRPITLKVILMKVRTIHITQHL